MLDFSQESIGGYFDPSSLDKALGYIDAFDSNIDYMYFNEGGLVEAEQFLAGEWDDSNTYAQGSIVTHNESRYIATKFVPTQIAITNTGYWPPYEAYDDNDTLLFSNLEFFRSPSQKSTGTGIKFPNGPKLLPGFNIIFFNTILYSDRGTIGDDERTLFFQLEARQTNGVNVGLQRRHLLTVKEGTIGTYTPIEFWNCRLQYEMPADLQLRYRLSYSENAQNRPRLRYNEMLILHVNSNHKR